MQPCSGTDSSPNGQRLQAVRGPSTLTLESASDTPSEGMLPTSRHFLSEGTEVAALDERFTCVGRSPF